eukprot:scaffold4755_cov50-Attheya_sp.AAC.1
MMRLSWVIVVALSVVGRFVEGAKCTGQPYFGKDFFLELGPLESGFGTEGRNVLLKALQDFQQTFETGWETSINAQGSNATFVSLEFAKWFVPEMLNEWGLSHPQPVSVGNGRHLFAIHGLLHHCWMRKRVT